MKKFGLSALALLAPAIAVAQDVPEALTFEGKEWRIAAQSASVERVLGREALRLEGGSVWLDDENFSDGVIEFDLAYEERMGFIGPRFRAENDGHFEYFYLRSHLNQKPDALQYTPTVNGLTGWQIFTDGNALAPLDQKFGEWNRIKVVVKGDRADFYYNSDTPVMHVPDLKTDLAEGAVGFSVGGQTNAHFSNFTIRPLEDGEDIIGEPKETPELPEGLITSWNVSSVFSEDTVNDTLKLSKDATDELTWTMLDVETNGIANIARTAVRLQDGGSTVFVRANIRSDKKQMKELQFGYSDRVRVYLNGKRVYYGNAGWRVRDYRFLGTVGFFDSVGLDLKRGDNELLIAVSETFGGWAWAGAMADQTGVEIE